MTKDSNRQTAEQTNVSKHPTDTPQYQLTKESLKIYKSLSKLISGTDIILFLLDVDRIRGKIVFQNQVFLAWKEIFYKCSVDLGYQPNPDGVYSQSVEDFSKFLEHNDSIKIIKSGRGVTYYITERGRVNAKNRALKLKINLYKLTDKKQDWDEWDKDGIRRYVARKYPYYMIDWKYFIPLCKYG